jgi:hypothetical protein
MPNFIEKDMLKKRVRWLSKPTFFQEHKVDKYRLQKDIIQLQKKKLPIYKWDAPQPKQ